MNKEIEIVLDVNLEHLNFWRYYIDLHFSFLNILISFFTFGLFGFALLAFFVNSFGETKFIGIIVLSFLFTILSLLNYVYLSAEIAVERAATINYIISNDKIKVITEGLTSEVQWDFIKSFKEIKNYFYLDTKVGQRIMLPKKDFADAQQLQEFKDLLNTKFGNKVYLKKSK